MPWPVYLTSHEKRGKRGDGWWHFLPGSVQGGPAGDADSSAPAKSKHGGHANEDSLLASAVLEEERSQRNRMLTVSSPPDHLFRSASDAAQWRGIRQMTTALSIYSGWHSLSLLAQVKKAASQ